MTGVQTCALPILHLAANERLAKERGIPVDVMAAERYEAIAMKRAGEPDEIAEVITFLAGPSAAFVTGTAIPISGGQPVGL